VVGTGEMIITNYNEMADGGVFHSRETLVETRGEDVDKGRYRFPPKHYSLLGSGNSLKPS
jgi:hypothetical protein